MSDLIDDLHIIMRVLMEDGYPFKYSNSIANAIRKLEEQATRIKELEGSLIQTDFECYCE